MRIGIVGAGTQGKKHAYKLSSLGIEVWVTDIEEKKAKTLSQEVGGKWVESFEDFRKGVDGVIIATPATTHYTIARFFLENSIPLLIEKPLVVKREEGEEIIKLARKRAIPVLVGMVERFHPGIKELKKRIKEPIFIEIHRVGPFPGRSLDIGVVLDLMLHDLDLLWFLLGEKPSSIEAIGAKVFTTFEDIVNVRLSFPSGCVSNLTASRVSEERMRKLRIFQGREYYSLSFPEGELKSYKVKEGELEKKTWKWKEVDPLKEEIIEFVSTVKGEKKSHISVENVYPSLDLAFQILEKIRIVG